MSALTFTMRAEPDQRLDLSILTPGRLAGLGEAEIAALPIGTTRELRTVGEVFAVAMGDLGDIRFVGGSERFDRIGEGLEAGAILVEGAVGSRVGRLMSGGRVEVRGHAGLHAGSAMAGGFLRIEGDAGDFLGGPLAGEMAGMTGGTLHVRGSVGERAGDRLRRGTIVVGGNAGADAGSRMVAGTLIVKGRAGATPGRLMRRGTIVAGGGAERVGATFLDNGVHDPLIFRLMTRAFAAGPLGEPVLDGAPMRRLGGDTAALGLGELFVPA